MTAKTHTDISGTPIKVGDYVAYAALWSRSATLKFGRVVKLVTEKKDWDGPRPCTKIQVVSVDRSFNDKWELQGIPWKQKYGAEEIVYEKCKIQTLEFLDRMIVVDRVRVPEEARDLLDKAFEAKSK